MDPMLEQWRKPLLIFACLLPLLGWWSYGLFDLDEGFYAAVVSHMLRTGDWITPHYGGQPWFEKPILLYWLSAPCVAVFGPSIGPRLPSILASLALYGLVWKFGNWALGNNRGSRAAVILSTSLLVVAVGRMMMTDALLNLFLSAALMAFYRSLSSQAAQYRAWAGACIGLGILAKGPVALILFAAVVGVFLVFSAESRKQVRGGWLGFWLLLIVVTCLWYVPAYWVNGQLFVQKFLIEQNIGRFTGGDLAHTIKGPIGIILYVPVLVLGMLPWVFLLPKAWINREEGEAKTFLKVWFLVIFLFFSVSAAKLPHYVLPATVPLALLLSTVGRRRFEWAPLIPSVLVFALVNFAFNTYYWGGFGLAGPHAEIHHLVNVVRSQPGGLAAYQMPRRDKALGTGSSKIQETSHPSIEFYANRPVQTVEALGDIRPDVRWMVTRSGRLDPSAAPSWLIREHTAHYELYERR